MKKFELGTCWELPTGLQVKVINATNLKYCQPYITFQSLTDSKLFIVRTQEECLNFIKLPLPPQPPTEEPTP